MRKLEVKHVPKTVSFDRSVYDAIQKRVDENEDLNFSDLVNLFCKQKVVGDKLFYAGLAKHYYLKFQEYLFLRDQADSYGKK